MEEEIWKQVNIKEFINIYEVSNYGNIKTSVRKAIGSYHYKIINAKLRKTTVNKGGYRQVTLHNNLYFRCFTVHRLVALTFIPNPENKPEVNHKDGNKLNNNDWNLEWSTKSENRLHAYRIGLQVPQRKSMWMKGRFNSCSFPVIQYENNNKIIEEHESAGQAGIKTGIDHSSISKCCRGKLKSAGNFVWKYKKDIKI